MGAEEPFGDREEEEPGSFFERFRTVFSLVATVALLVAAAGAAVVGGLVASGVGGEPLQRPPGDAFSFQINTSQNVTQLEVRYAEESIPNVDRLYVVDGDGNRVAWTAASAGSGAVVRVSGTDSDLSCLQQGDNYRIVFDGRATSGTIAAYQIADPIPPERVDACLSAAAETETPGFG